MFFILDQKKRNGWCLWSLYNTCVPCVRDHKFCVLLLVMVSNGAKFKEFRKRKMSGLKLQNKLSQVFETFIYSKISIKKSFADKSIKPNSRNMFGKNICYNLLQ